MKDHYKRKGVNLSQLKHNDRIKGCYLYCTDHYFFVSPVVHGTGTPNIIFFFTDDRAYDTQKDYGNPDVKTPNLDILANEGMVFLRHYNTTAICMASRASEMTGQYEYKTGCNFEHGHLSTKQWSNSYPVLLKQSGYSVGFAGKFGFSISDSV